MFVSCSNVRRYHEVPLRGLFCGLYNPLAGLPVLGLWQRMETIFQVEVSKLQVCSEGWPLEDDNYPTLIESVQRFTSRIACRSSECPSEEGWSLHHVTSFM